MSSLISSVHFARENATGPAFKWGSIHGNQSSYTCAIGLIRNNHVNILCLKPKWQITKVVKVLNGQLQKETITKPVRITSAKNLGINWNDLKQRDVEFSPISTTAIQVQRLLLVSSSRCWQNEMFEIYQEDTRRVSVVREKKKKKMKYLFMSLGVQRCRILRRVRYAQLSYHFLGNWDLNKFPFETDPFLATVGEIFTSKSCY